MANEVTVIIYDTRGRSADWWEEYLYVVVGNADADLMRIETEEV